MSGLPWVRLDSNIASHDKVLALLADPSPQKWRAYALYTFGLGYSGGHGTDGFVPAFALPVLHATPQHARLLEKYHLWDEVPNGWRIRNFEERQELSIVRAAKRAAQQMGGKKGACIKHHGPKCGCWKEDDT
jgi:hypothetical protein